MLGFGGLRVVCGAVTWEDANRFCMSRYLTLGRYTDYCAAVQKEPCPTGASCCCESPCAAKGAAGYCFAVSNCSKVPPAGDPFKVAAFLYGVHLDTGALVRKVPLCSLEPSNATVDQACPWSVESAGAEEAASPTMVAV